MKTKTKKQQEQVSRSEELNVFQKKGEEQKKTKRSSRSHVMVNTNQKKETDERIVFLVTSLSLLALQLGGVGGPQAPLPQATPMLFIHKIFEQNFINMNSNKSLHNTHKDL